MAWGHNRPSYRIPRKVQLEVWDRAGGRCELRRLGCQGDVRLEFHHIVSIAETGVPVHTVGNIALACHWCHSLETKEQAYRARLNTPEHAHRAKRTYLKLQPERHPGLKRQ